MIHIHSNGIHEAIAALAQGEAFALTSHDYDGLVWTSAAVEKPTREAVAAKQAEIVAAYQAAEYQRQRIAEYPPIGDQLDALWKGGDAAVEMLARVQAVKDKYPKPV